MTDGSPNDANFPDSRLAAALDAWRALWNATPPQDRTPLRLWTTMRDAACACRLVDEKTERAFCRNALEEAGLDAERRLADCDDAALAAQTRELLEATAAKENAPTLAELFVVLGLANAADAESNASPLAESRDFGSRSASDAADADSRAPLSQSLTSEEWACFSQGPGGAVPPSQARPLAPGEIVALSDDYEIKRIVGKGGQKAVYEVVSKRLGTRFAVKELLSELGGSEARRRDLEREVKLQASLQHQGIPKVFALSPDLDPTSKGLPRFVETYVEGEPWSAKPFDRAHFEQNLDYLLQVAKIMAYVHEKGGVVHRDLKPANIMINDFGELYVVDWGMAFNCRDEGPQSGAIGTLSYMAPEQASGEPVDYRADVFSLGAILYEILTGFAPYEIALRTQGSASAARRAQACDFPPLDPNAAKAELLRLAEEALTSPDAAPELRALAEKAVLVVASPSEILTFAEKKALDLPIPIFSEANVVKFSPFDDVGKIFKNLFSKKTAVARRLTAADVANIVSKSRLSRLAQELRQDIAKTLSSSESSETARRLAEAALIASTPLPSKLFALLQTALAQDPAKRFPNASAFVAAFVAYRPQNETLEAFNDLKRRFKDVMFFLNVKITKTNRRSLELDFEQGTQILTECSKLRVSTQQNVDIAFAANQQLITALYEYEIGMRYYLINKALLLEKFAAAHLLLDEQRDVAHEYAYATSDATKRATILKTLEKQTDEVKQAIHNATPVTLPKLRFLTGFVLIVLGNLYQSNWLLVTGGIFAAVGLIVLLADGLGAGWESNDEQKKLMGEIKNLRDENTNLRNELQQKRE